MQNNEGKVVDTYIPRKWCVFFRSVSLFCALRGLSLTAYAAFSPNSDATNRIIDANDHASIQLNVGEVDAEGRFTGEYKAYAISGFVRALGESDDSLNRLLTNDGFLKRCASLPTLKAAHPLTCILLLQRLEPPGQLKCP